MAVWWSLENWIEQSVVELGVAWHDATGESHVVKIGRELRRRYRRRDGVQHLIVADEPLYCLLGRLAVVAIGVRGEPPDRVEPVDSISGVPRPAWYTTHGLDYTIYHCLEDAHV